MNWYSFESRAECWFRRNVTIACATVIRRIIRNTPLAVSSACAHYHEPTAEPNPRSRSPRPLSAYRHALILVVSSMPAVSRFLLVCWSLLFGVDYHTSGKRGSVSFQVDFSQTWLGSSVTARVREVPARKLR